ncbi:MAG: tyrosine-type recombinase/integrase [Erythrobacter sp.]
MAVLLTKKVIEAASAKLAAAAPAARAELQQARDVLARAATPDEKAAAKKAVGRAEGKLRVELHDTKTSGLRIRIGERGAKWSVQKRTVQGGIVRVPLESWPKMDVDAAREEAENVAVELRKGINRNEQRKAARTYSSLRELLDIYDKAKLAQLRSGPGAKRAIEAALAKLLSDDPARITRVQIAGAIDKLAETAPIHANRTLAYAKAFFAWAVDRGHMTSNPAIGMSKPKEENPRDRTPSLPELVEIWNAAGALGYPFGPAVRLLMTTAMRREEISGMAASEIDLPDEGDAVFTLPAERSKNKRAIRVPFSPLARGVLEEALDGRPVIDKEKGTKSDLIFTTTGETPASGWSKAKSRLDTLIATARKKAAAEAGVDAVVMPAWRIHDLRRSFATVACDVLHIDSKVLDRCLNHVGASTTSTISRVYGRSELFDQRKAALNAWGNLLQQAIEPRQGENVVPLKADAA